LITRNTSTNTAVKSKDDNKENIKAESVIKAQTRTKQESY